MGTVLWVLLLWVEESRENPLKHLLGWSEQEHIALAEAF